jgi:hypothetical protein
LKYIVEKLDNPQDVWQKAFDKDSDEFNRIIVILTIFNGNKIEEDKLRNSYNRYVELAGLTNNSHTSKDFDSVIKEVVKYFLNRNQTYSKKIEYSLFNPSIADFVLNKYKNNSAILKQVYISLSSVESLKELNSLSLFKKFDKPIYEEIVLFLYEQLDIETENIDYAIKLLYMVEFINIRRDNNDVLKRNTFVQNMINNPKDFDLIDEFVSIVSFMDLDEIEINSHDFILKIIENASLEEDVVNSKMKLIDIFYITDEEIIQKINKFVNEYVEQELDGYMSDIGIGDVDFEEHIGGEMEDGGDYMETKEYYVKDGCIEDCIDSGFNEVVKNLNLDKKIVIDRDRVISSIDIDKINERLVESYIYTNDYEPEHRDVVRIVVDSIDDLFQR